MARYKSIEAQKNNNAYVQQYKKIIMMRLVF